MFFSCNRMEIINSYLGLYRNLWLSIVYGLINYVFQHFKVAKIVTLGPRYKTIYLQQISMTVHSEYPGKRDVTLIFPMSQQDISNNPITSDHHDNLI
jgi:hypothetical protein